MVRRVRGPRERGAIGFVGALVSASVLVASAGVGFAVQRVVVDDEPAALPSVGRVPVPAHPCPGGPEVGTVHHGDRVFAVGVHEELDGWLLIRNPAIPTEQWWVEHRFVQTDGPTGDLPSVTCEGTPVPTESGVDLAAGDVSSTTAPPPDDVDGEESTTTEPEDLESTSATGPQSTSDPSAPNPPGPGTSSTTTTEPRSSTTAPSRRTTTTTTRPPTTTTTRPPTTTTAAKDTSGPSLSVSRSAAEIWETEPGFCTGLAKASTISASATDPSGVASVRATWSVGNLNENKSLASGSAQFGPYPGDTVAHNAQETVIVTVTATDTAGNSTVRTTSIVVHHHVQCFG